MLTADDVIDMIRANPDTDIAPRLMFHGGWFLAADLGVRGGERVATSSCSWLIKRYVVADLDTREVVSYAELLDALEDAVGKLKYKR